MRTSTVTWWLWTPPPGLEPTDPVLCWSKTQLSVSSIHVGCTLWILVRDTHVTKFCWNCNRFRYLAEKIEFTLRNVNSLECPRRRTRSITFCTIFSALCERRPWCVAYWNSVSLLRTRTSVTSNDTHERAVWSSPSRVGARQVRSSS